MAMRQEQADDRTIEKKRSDMFIRLVYFLFLGAMLWVDLLRGGVPWAVIATLGITLVLCMI